MASSDSTPLTIEIPLTRGYVAIVDIHNGDLAEVKWSAVGKRGYAVREFRVDGKKKREYLHRVVLSRMIGRELALNEQADHINGNTFDNRESNIRLVNGKQNCQNRKRGSHNKSGFKGVSWVERDRRWRAVIRVNYKYISLGYYLTPEEAYAAYCQAAIKYFGEYANMG